MIVIREQIKEEKNRPSQGKESCACPSVNRQNTGLKEVRFAIFYSTPDFLCYFKTLLQERLDCRSLNSENVLFPWLEFSSVKLSGFKLYSCKEADYVDTISGFCCCAV